MCIRANFSTTVSFSPLVLTLIISCTIERLWQLTVLLFRNEKMVVRSCEEQDAMNLLKTKIQGHEVKGVHRHATTQLRRLLQPQRSDSRENQREQKSTQL